MRIKSLCNRNSEEYWKFIASIDRDFLPTLSKREGGIKAFINKVYDEKGKVFVCENGTEIAGSLSYWITPEKDIYVWLLANSLELKDSYLGARVIIELTKYGLLEERKNNLRNIVCTTWSTNSPAMRLYNHLGLEVYKTIPNDMVNGRTTLRYNGSFNNVYERVLK